MNRIEVHCHFLPGVDDGCRDVEESLACLRIMAEAGYAKIFCTPHVGPDGCPETLDMSAVLERLETLRTHAAQANIPVELKPGGEVRIRHEMPEILARFGVPSFGHEGKYVLVDTWEEKWPAWQTRAIEWLQKKGLTVILAHPERMPVLHSDPAFITELVRMGILFQGNLGPIAGADSPRITALSHRFLQDGRYFLLATDGHRPPHMPTRLTGLDKARELVGTAVIDELTIRNPARLWGA